jgi:hypothetical protein
MRAFSRCAYCWAVVLCAVWQAVPDAVGLMWARGSHIYVCAGCVPDHSIEFVVLDPDDLVPLSDVLKISPAEGGLLRRSAAVQATTYS